MSRRLGIDNPYPKDVYLWDNKEKLPFDRGRFNQHCFEIWELAREETAKAIFGEIMEIVERNALSQTTYSNICWDDGDIMFKRTDTKAKGDWSQENWDKKIRNFNPMFLKYDEIRQEIGKLRKEYEAP